MLQKHHGPAGKLRNRNISDETADPGAVFDHAGFRQFAQGAPDGAAGNPEPAEQLLFRRKPLSDRQHAGGNLARQSLYHFLSR